jgi:chemotaxis family two-component system sensor kinase Cph1
MRHGHRRIPNLRSTRFHRDVFDFIAETCEKSMKNQGQGVAPQTSVEDNEWARDFISMAVHDLREPLRGVRLGAQLMTATGENAAAENVDRGARYVQDGLDRMETLIRDIAEYCYAELGDAHFYETDLESVFIEVQKELYSELKSSEAGITHDSLPMVVGDGPSLAAVFRSLIANACKFRGETPPRIHVGVVRRGPEWIFSVRDNGLGFDPTYRERIFRPFERLNGRQYPGSGLGLSVARTIIEQHRGKIWAESNPGEGSTFRFSLPG